MYSTIANTRVPFSQHNTLSQRSVDTDCLSIDRLHANRHVVLFKHVIKINSSLLMYLIGKHEDVVLVELEDVVVDR